MIGKVKYYIEQSWVLVAAAFVFGLLLAVTNSAWSDRIEQNKKDKLNNLMGSLIADANFSKAMEDVEITYGKGQSEQVDIYKASGPCGRVKGYCFGATGSGFADKIELVIAIDSACEKILGYRVLSSNETPGFGDRISNDYYRSQFAGAPADELELIKSDDKSVAKVIDDQIVSISGATVSSQAVVKMFNSFVNDVKEIIQSEGLADGK